MGVCARNLSDSNGAIQAIPAALVSSSPQAQGLVEAERSDRNDAKTIILCPERTTGKSSLGQSRP